MNFSTYQLVQLGKVGNLVVGNVEHAEFLARGEAVELFNQIVREPQLLERAADIV